MSIGKLDVDWLNDGHLDEVESAIDYNDFKISPDVEVEKPTPILSIKQEGRFIDIFTEENISMIQGQAKSRKSTLIKAICQGILVGNYKFHSDYERKRIAIIDTEMDRYRCYLAVKSIKNMSNGMSVDYFSVVGVKTNEIKTIVENYIKDNPYCGFVILDNIVHFLTNFNDVEESADLLNWLLRIKKEYNIHILCVLHENPGETRKARGTLGTNLANLCESIIRIEIDKNDRSRSIVSPHMMRGLEFKPFVIEQDVNWNTIISDLEDEYTGKAIRY